MKTAFLPCLALLALAPFAQAAKPVDDGVFHDPFAEDAATSGQSAAKPATSSDTGEFHDPFASEDAASEAKPATAVSDPLEGMNRFFFKFNDKLYTWVLKPLAQGYSFVTPKPARECVDRFFVNLKYPVRGVNNLLEGRFAGAGIETARFVVNTTVGIGGLFDPASHWNLKAHPASFDQTLAVYRIPAGIYLNLPILGPSSPRGVVGTTGDMFLNPAFYVDPDWIGYAAGGTDRVNFTSLHYPEYDSLKAGTLDPYVAMRSAYLENRRATVEKK